MSQFSFINGSKFSLVAIENCYVELSADCLVSDGTWALATFPCNLDDYWKRWLGEIWLEKLGRVNLILLRQIPSSNPEILDQEHTKLQQEVSDFFILLHLAGILEYEGAITLKGSIINNQHQIRSIGGLNTLYRTHGLQRQPVNIGLLEKTAQIRKTRETMQSTPTEYERLLRGLRIFIDGLGQQHGEERLHQFVRALEALIVPAPGQTRRQFINRCQTFTSTTTGTDNILWEAFDMRSDVEHVHEWDRNLSSFAPIDREEVALQRTRQMEALARIAYSKIFTEAAIQTHFKTDLNLNNFWQLNVNNRRAIWGGDIDIVAIT